jgi:hypothetical protein
LKAEVNAVLPTENAELAYEPAEFAVDQAIVPLADVKELLATVNAPLAYSAAEFATYDGVLATKNAEFAYVPVFVILVFCVALTPTPLLAEANAELA